jgi:carbamoyl-phosphate synthase large subunit
MATAQRLGAKAIIPASEQEIERLRAQPALAAQPAVVLPTMAAGVQSADKLSVFTALNTAVPMAPFADGADHAASERVLAQSGGCVVVKPRRGRGSKGIAVCRTVSELRTALVSVESPLVQGWLEGQEWSVGVHRRARSVHVCALLRDLSGLGLSMYAEVLRNAAVEEYAAHVAHALDVQGAVNVQLRLTAQGPRLLEVNARFSSLTSARAAAGFHDALWCVEDALGLPPTSPRDAAPRHVRFQRYFSEVLEVDGAANTPPEWTPHLERSAP